jgi:replicative DNA helicase
MEKIKKLVEYEQRLANYDGEDRVISRFEMEERLKNEKNPYRFFLKIPSLDNLVDGFETGELIIISGPTKHGKTTLAKTFTERLAEQKINCLWFSYEMPPKQLLKKFPENVLFYLPAVLKSKSLIWIEERIWEAKIKYDVRTVFIDHLHFLFDLAQLRHPSLQIGTLVRQLKGIAIKHNVLIFLICHLTKTKTERLPALEDLRDSSFIAQESDCVLTIFRLLKGEEDSNRAKLTIHTHRRTGVMRKSINLIFKDDSFYELDTFHEEL